MSIQNTKDDSFEEKIPDEDTFAEIGDDSSSSSNRLTKLTRKPINLDKQIEKVPLKDHSLLPKIKRNGNGNGTHSSYSRSNSRSKSRSPSQFRISPTSQFRGSPVGVGRLSPTMFEDTSHEDYVKAALQAARHRSFSSISLASLGADMSDLTDEEGGIESTLEDIRLSEYTLDRILRSCENTFDFLDNINLILTENDFDSLMSKFFTKIIGGSFRRTIRLPRHNDPPGRFRYATVVLPELQSNLNVQDDDESDSPPSIRNRSPDSIENIENIQKPIAIRPKTYEEHKEELRIEANQKAENMANILTNTIISGIKDDLKDEEENIEKDELEYRRQVDVNRMVNLVPDLSINTSEIPEDISPRNYTNLRQNMFLLYSNILISRGMIESEAVEKASKYLEIPDNKIVSEENMNGEQKALFARIYETIIGFGKINQFYFLLETYNIYLASLKTYSFIKDQLTEQIKIQEYTELIDKLNIKMETHLKSTKNTKFSLNVHQELVKDIEILLKNVNETQKNLKYEIDDTSGDVEDSLTIIRWRIEIFLKSLSNPTLKQPINGNMMTLFLLKSPRRFLSPILIAAKEVQKIPKRSIEFFDTQKIFGIEIELLGLVLPPNIANYFFPNHAVSIFWVMAELMRTIYYTKTWTIAMMGSTVNAIGCYSQQSLIEILSILKEWSSVSQTSFDNWINLIEDNKESEYIRDIVNGWWLQIYRQFGDYVDEITNIQATMAVMSAANLQSLGRFSPLRAKELLVAITRFKGGGNLNLIGA